MDNPGADVSVRDRSVLERLTNAFERRPLRWSLLFVLPFLALLLVKAMLMPMWLDEFYTLWVAQQPSISSSIDAVREGCDNAPPLYALIVKFFQRTIGETPLALRLPSFLGFCLMLGCTFVFLRRRLGNLYAAMGVLISASSTYSFATEGRPYGLTLGCIALALLCWQVAADGYRRPLALAGLLIGMAMAISLHYYAVFVLIPLGLAELSREVSRRRVDLPMVFVLLLSPLILILHLPVILAGRVFVENFYKKGSLADIPLFYRGALSDATLWVPLAVFLLAISLILPCGADNVPEQKGRPGFRHYELVGAFALAFLPVFAIPAAHIVIGIARAAYFFPAMLGIAMIFSAVLFRLERGRLLVPLALVVALSGWLGAHALYQAADAPRLRYAGALPQMLKGIPSDPAPILVPSPHAFVELWYYGDPQIRRRVMSTANDSGQDTVSRMWLAIIRRVSVPVLPNDSFLQSTPRFILADAPGSSLAWTFVHSGYRVTPLEQAGLFIVESTAAPPATH